MIWPNGSLVGSGREGLSRWTNARPRAIFSLQFLCIFRWIFSTFIFVSCSCLVILSVVAAVDCLFLTFPSPLFSLFYSPSICRPQPHPSSLDTVLLHVYHLDHSPASSTITCAHAVCFPHRIKIGRHTQPAIPY